MTYTNNRNNTARGVFSRRIQEHPLAFLSELERQFAQFAEPTKPAGVEIHDAGEKYIIIAEAMGIESDKIDIEVLGKTVRITGSNILEEKSVSDSNHKNDEDAENVDESNATTTQETAYSWKPKTRKINYELRLPENVVADEVEADLALGLLTITAPKLPAAQGKKVSINNK